MNDTFRLNQNQKKQSDTPPKKLTLYQQIVRVLLVIGVFFYPFFIVGGCLFSVFRIVVKVLDKQHTGEFEYIPILKRHTASWILAAVIGFIVNCFLFVFVWPRGYLSGYLFFPLNLFDTVITFTPQTVYALLAGGLGVACIMGAFVSFKENRKVVSKEKELNEIRESKDYKQRRADRFAINEALTKEYNRNYDQYIRLHAKEKLATMRENVFLGVDEFGNPQYVSLKELNQHMLLNATTGAGKTTILKLIITHCAMFHIPCLYINGKGDKEMEEIMMDIAQRYDRPMKALTDHNNLRYNVVKHGNSVAVRDRLSIIAETESIFYTGNNKALLMGTIQLIDVFSIKRTLPNIMTYLEPQHVLTLFWQAIQHNSFTSQRQEEHILVNRFDDDTLAVNSTQDNGTMPADLDELYAEVAKHSSELTPPQGKLFRQLFQRYEVKDSGYLYLYKTVEALQISIGLLLDSEIGYLFDTEEENVEELDLYDDTNNNYLLYVSLDGLVYQEYISKLAHFVTSDINYMASKRFQTNITDTFFVLFDEPSTYLSPLFIDTLNKTRHVGIHCIVSPQSLGDIENIDPILLRRVIDNVNTFMAGQTNHPDYVEQLANLMGTWHT
ncbi:P-loop NTPase family protein [Enterococcus sp. LJL90]